MTASHQGKQTTLCLTRQSSPVTTATDSGSEEPSQMGCLETQFLLEGLTSEGIIEAIPSVSCYAESHLQNDLITPQLHR